MIPHLDRLSLKSFAGPFIIAFLGAWFVLTMQFLWFFLEKIADKGLSFNVILELIIYRSAGLIPLAIPLAALIASVMVIGGMAERYEWSAFQSAGVSLLRLLRPLMILGMFFVGISYLTANYLIPAANLRFYQRLADVYQKKPDLSLDTGVFNGDLDRFVLYAAGRSPDGQLKDVILYDQRKQDGQINQINAAEGSFSNQGQDATQLFLTLRQGEHYQEELQPGRTPSFVRTSFSTYTLSFDLSQFDLKRGDQFSGGDHHALLTTSELQAAADSVAADIHKQELTIRQELDYFMLKQMSEQVLPPESRTQEPAIRISQNAIRIARSQNRRQSAETKLQLQKLRSNQEVHSRYLYEKHAKLGLAAVCFIFVLVGGATGAIVRKGGFGFPLLLSVGCFISYILLLEFCRRLTKSLVLSGPAAGWIPVLLLAVIAAGLVWRAARWA